MSCIRAPRRVWRRAGRASIWQVWKFQRPGRVPLRGGGAVRMRSTARAVRGRSSTLGLVEIETVIVHPRAPARAFSPGGSAPAPARRGPGAGRRGAGPPPFRLPLNATLSVAWLGSMAWVPNPRHVSRWRSTLASPRRGVCSLT